MSRYNDAVFEHEQEDENGRAKNVYAYFGLAVYQSQCLEEAFYLMLIKNRIITKKIKTNREINDFMDKFETSKRTMGNLVNEVKQAYNLSEETKNELTSLLNRRNYLAHKYFKENTQKFYSETGQKDMLKYFCEFIDHSRKLEEELKAYYFKTFEKMGLTEERLQQLMNDIINEEREEKV